MLKSVSSVAICFRVPWWVGVVVKYELSWSKVTDNTTHLHLKSFWIKDLLRQTTRQTPGKIIKQALFSARKYLWKGWRDLARVNQYVGIRPLCCRRLTTCCSYRGTKWPIYLSTASAQSAAVTQGYNRTAQTPEPPLHGVCNGGNYIHMNSKKLLHLKRSIQIVQFW